MGRSIATLRNCEAVHETTLSADQALGRVLENESLHVDSAVYAEHVQPQLKSSSRSVESGRRGERDSRVQATAT